MDKEMMICSLCFNRSSLLSLLILLFYYNIRICPQTHGALTEVLIARPPMMFFTLAQ